jgi:hypothetical protein
MADRVEDKGDKIKQAANLLLEARDALPAISLTAAKLHSLDLTLADRIEDWLKPWCSSDEQEAS